MGDSMRLGRNALVFKQQFDHPNEVYAGAVSALAEFTPLNTKEEESVSHGPSIQQPTEAFLKY
jgi:hypothetical protein